MKSAPAAGFSGIRNTHRCDQEFGPARRTNERGLLLPGRLVVRLVLWSLIFVVFPLSGTSAVLSFNLEVLGRINSPHNRGVLRKDGELAATLDLAERVLLRLEDAEKKEIDPWVRDDLRIAWITTLYAWRGNQQPHIDATYRVLGVHPDEVWPRMQARREAQCGSLYEQVWGSASSPKKPVQSVKFVKPKAAPRKDLAA
jgi:hypothetical protein